MKNTLRPVVALLISVAILLTGQGLQGTLLPTRASLENFPTLAIGTMGAVYFLGFTLGCLKGGDLIKRVGHVRVFLAMTALASASPLLHGLIIHPTVWSLLRMLTGFCFAVLYVVIESWLNEQSSNDNRGAVFGTYVMITLTAMAGGQMMNLLYDPTGLQLFVIASVLVSIAALPVALSTSPAPQVPHSVSINMPRLFRVSPVGAIACLACGLANGAFWALAPVFTVALSSDVTLAAWFMTAAVLGGAGAQWPLGVMSDRVGRRNVLAVMGLIGTIISAAAAIGAAQFGFISIILIGAAWGCIAFPLYSIAVAHTNDFALPSEYVTVSAGLLLLYGVGAIAGPILASAAMTWLGAGGLFLFIAYTHGLLTLIIIYRMLRGRNARVADPVPFVESLAVAQTASQVYEEEAQQEAMQED
ncbi:MAG TPA: MFS transporter [Woeseiaceae bacterium]|nr:MFS transporter [Woeseiaceae bacterium]